MTPAQFAQALSESGVVVAVGILDGLPVFYLEVYKGGELVRIVLADHAQPVPLAVRRQVCLLLGLKEADLPVSIRDILDI